MDKWEQVQHVRIFVSHVNSHQKASTTKKSQNTGVDRMGHSIASLMGSQAAMEAGMKLMMGLIA